MQAHWVNYADAALFSRFEARRRQLAEQPPLDPLKPEDRALADTFPYVSDLARLGALLPVLHWRDPAYLREVVEAYRTRLHRTVEIYKNGLGTLPAMRSMVEVQLPLDMERPADQRDHPFWLEEFAPAPPRLFSVPTIGAPDWHRWSLDGLEHRQQQRPASGAHRLHSRRSRGRAADDRAHRYASGHRLHWHAGCRRRVLRLRPVFSSWLATTGGLQRADSDADPTAPGPWAATLRSACRADSRAASVPRRRALGRSRQRIVAFRRRNLDVGVGRSARRALPGRRRNKSPGRR